MKRLALAIVMAGAVGGCVPSDLLNPAADKTAPKPLEPARTTAMPPVTASQINPANAHEKAEALRRELDRDMEQALDSNDVKK